MIGQPLQQQRHPHATFGRVDQRLAEPPAGKEIGVGDDDLVARAGDRVQIGVLDRVPVAQVVAHDVGRADIARRLGARRGKQWLRITALEARPRHQAPQALR